MLYLCIGTGKLRAPQLSCSQLNILHLSFNCYLEIAAVCRQPRNIAVQAPNNFILHILLRESIESKDRMITLTGSYDPKFQCLHTLYTYKLWKFLQVIDARWRLVCPKCRLIIYLSTIRGNPKIWQIGMLVIRVEAVHLGSICQGIDALPCAYVNPSSGSADVLVEAISQ